MASKPVIVVCRKLPSAVEARLARDYEARRNSDDRIYEQEELLALCRGADAILPCPTEQISAEFIEKLPESVKIVSSFSVGVDHIDLDAARARGIVVTNTPDVLSDATAEIAILLLLGAARRAAEGDRIVRENRWASWSPNYMVGTQMTGKRLGIVGMGRVGRIVARRARGFDMEIHYHNRHPVEGEAATYHAGVEDLLPHCDFLSLNCPLTPETHHLLDARRIALLPDGAVVANTARGPVVDDDALIRALQSGKLAAAGLDVFEGEPAIDARYRELPNVFLLPHIGSATRETRDAMGFRALDNLDAFFAGKPPRDRVA